MMQKNYLAFFETIVSTQFPKTRSIQKITQEYVDTTIPVIEQEEQKLTSHLIYNLSAAMGENVRADRVRTKQLKIIHLIDDVFSYFLVPNPNMEHHFARLKYKLGKTLQASLIRILNTIEVHYAALIDFNVKVPFAYRKSACASFKKNLTVLEVKFCDAKVSPQLFELIADPYRTFIKGGITQHLSYRKLFYLNILMQSLLNVAPDTNQPDRAVVNLLISLNFNDINFARYYVAHLQEQCKNKNIAEIIAYTKEMKTDINIYLDNAFKPRKPDWTVLFESAKEEAIKNLEKKAECIAFAEKWKEFKIQTSLTVDEIAGMTILWMEAGLISNKNKKEIAAFIATFFKSTRSENISADSMRNALYTMKPATMAKLRTIFDQLIKLTRKLE